MSYALTFSVSVYKLHSSTAQYALYFVCLFGDFVR